MTKLKALSVEKIIKDEGADTAATKANVALVVAIWPNIFDIVAFLQLRSLYATAGMNDCLALVKTMVQKRSSSQRLGAGVGSTLQVLQPFR